MRGGVTTVGIFGGTTAGERRHMLGRVDTVRVTRPIVHGEAYSYRSCARRPERACVACKRAHAREVAAMRSAGGFRTDVAVAWTKRFIRRLRAAALVESWALRNEMEVA